MRVPILEENHNKIRFTFYQKCSSSPILTLGRAATTKYIGVQFVSAAGSNPLLPHRQLREGPDMMGRVACASCMLPAAAT